MRYVTDATLGRCLLLDDLPEASAGYRSRHDAPAEVETGLTGIERRAVRTGGRLRTGLTWSVIARGDAMADVAAMVQAYQNEPVLFPFWPGLTRSGVAPRFTAPRWLTWDGSRTAVATSPFVPGTEMVWPLLAGRFVSLPEVSLLIPDAVELLIDAEENDPGGQLEPTTYTPATGPSGLPIFPVWPDTGQPQTSGGVGIVVDWTEHLPSLTSQPIFYPQPLGRRVELNLVLAGDLPPQVLISFFAARGGLTGSFWLPLWLNFTRLSVPAAAGATILEVEDADALAPERITNQRVALFGAPVLEVATYTATGNRLTLGTPLVNSWGTDALLTLAIRARFAGARLAIDWTLVTAATASVAFLEPVNEYAPPPGETAGVTYGDAGTVLNLFAFTRTLPDGSSTVLRYTDAAFPVEHSGATWAPLPLTFDQITSSLDLEADSVRLAITSDGSDPLAQMMTDREALWGLEIIELSNGTPTTIFSGELRGPSADGPALVAEAVRLGGLGERRVPPMLVQTGCNVRLHSRACGVDRATWRFTGSVANAFPDVNQMVLQVTSTPAPAGEAWKVFGWFTGGLLVVGANAWRIRTGGTNQNEPGRLILFVLPGPPWPAVGAAASWWRECDGLFSTCGGVFSNADRFVGFPHLPVGNPSLGTVRQDTPTPSKK